MILHNHPIISLRVVIATIIVFLFLLAIPVVFGRLSVCIVGLRLICGWSLGLCFLDALAEVVDLGEVENLGLLVVGQVPLAEQLQTLGGGHWELYLLIVYIVGLADFSACGCVGLM